MGIYIKMVNHGIPLCGWHSRNHGTLHTEQASLRDETPAQGPQFSLGGRTKDLWKSGLPRPHGQRNSVPEGGV